LVFLAAITFSLKTVPVNSPIANTSSSSLDTVYLRTLGVGDWRTKTMKDGMVRLDEILMEFYFWMISIVVVMVGIDGWYANSNH